MQRLRLLIARNPSRTLWAGKLLLIAGSLLVLAAVFTRVYPQYRTWLVPEGPLGYSIAAVLVLAGMVLVTLAEKAGKR